MAAGSVHSTNPEPAAGSMVRRDYLLEHSKDIAGILALLAVSVLIASIATGVARGLPDVAFGWTFGLIIVRAAVVFAVVAIVVMFLARGWGGIWPARLSTTGIDYEQVGEASRELTRGAAELVRLAPLVGMVRAEAEAARKESQE